MSKSDSMFSRYITGYDPAAVTDDDWDALMDLVARCLAARSATAAETPVDLAQ